SGDLDTAALLAHCGSNSGFVVRWYDQSGNARDATQATAGSQPRVVNAGALEALFGLPTVWFDGVARHLRADAVASAFSGTAKAASFALIAQDTRASGSTAEGVAVGMGRSTSNNP